MQVSPRQDIHCRQGASIFLIKTLTAKYIDRGEQWYQRFDTGGVRDFLQ